MVRCTTTKISPPSANYSLLDAIAMAIENMEEGTLILQIITDFGENEALIIHATNDEEEEE